jgi:hypothetical protein
VITDSAWHCDPEPDEFIIERLDATFGAKPSLLYRCTPFDRTIFLDTDTVLVRDLAPVLNLLDYYEFCVRFVGGDLTVEPSLLYHPTASSGVIVFRKCDNVARLFEMWLNAYGAAARSGAAGRPSGPPDDKYLAGAIARSGARAMHLPEHLIFNLCEPSICFSTPVVCHGRHKNLTKIARYLSGQWTRTDKAPWQRVWLPNLLGLLPNGLRRSDPFMMASFVIRRIVSEVRYAIGRDGSDDSNKR